MTRDPRAFGLPARHDEEFARLERALDEGARLRSGLGEHATQRVCGEEELRVRRERYVSPRPGLYEPAGMGRREPQGGETATAEGRDSEVGRAGSSAGGATSPVSREVRR
jgi:hypothetical protein